MAKTKNFTSSFGGYLVIGNSNETWVVAQGVRGYGASGTLFEEVGVDNKIIIDGKLETIKDGTAIFSHGVHTQVEIGKSGLIDAYVGVKLAGSNQTLVNNGLIGGGNNAVIASGNYVDITNNGTMQSDVAISVYSYHGTFTNNGNIYGYIPISFGGEDSKLVIGKTGMISGESEGVESFGDYGDTITIVNDGYIAGGSRGMSLFHADFNIVNRGEIKGDVVSFDGASTFDFRQGKLDGKIYGHDGDDTYLVSSMKTAIVENQDMGYDTIKSTVSYNLSTGVNSSEEIEALRLLGSKNINATGDDDYNQLFGNDGKNVLSGRGGIDCLDGGKGNDILTGGAGTDYFTFKTGGGHDVITDFVKYTDQIDLTAWQALTSFSDMMKNHIRFEDGDAIITAGKDMLTFEDTSKSEFDKIDFFF